jgi:hypothetical protein
MQMLRVAVLFLLGVGPAAWAADPKFEYGKKEDVKPEDEWKASVQAGLILTSGNSQITTFSGGAALSYKHASEKFALDVAGAFARSEILVGTDTNMNGTIGPDEIDRIDQTTTKNVAGKIRYDHFFTDHDTVFLAGKGLIDEPAGKELAVGGQAGYSRRIYKDDVHELVGEIGYDFSYESYVADVPSVSIHSLRAFLGYTAKISEDTGFKLEGEGLFNLNSEDGPTGSIDAFDDTRVNAKTQVTTKLAKHIDLRFSFTVHFDNSPAPRPPFPGIKFDPGFVPLADKVDTITEMAVLVNFL